MPTGGEVNLSDDGRMLHGRDDRGDPGGDPMSKRRDQRPLDRIAPDDLPERIDADVETIDDAVEYLHKFGESSTPDEQRPRCPECDSVRIGPVTGDPQQYDDDTGDHEYRCTNWHRFDDPAPPLAEVDDDAGELADRDEIADNSFEWVSADDLEEPPLTRQLEALDDRTLTALAIYCYAPWEDAGPSYRELKTIFPYSRQWIGERVRAWRDGEYRELVPDPRPWRVGDV
jgi:hypothetical protein